MKEAGNSDPDRLLHARLLAGDPGALESLFKLFSRPMVRRLSARPRFRRTDSQRVEDAVLNALAEYNSRPASFDPSRGRSLEEYLAFAAGRDLLNLLRSETRRRRREDRAAHDRAEKEKSVELPSPAGNVLKTEEAERVEALRRRALALLAEPLDRQIFEMQLAGEKKTSAFARVLGITHLSVAEQKREVKRVKDRIDKTLRRGAGHE